jgi:DNA-binding NarL/FixJ family response regulator
MGRIRVFLVHRFELVRAGIRALLERVPGVQFVGESGMVGTVIRQVRAHRPHVVVIDVVLLDGFVLAVRLRRELKGIRVLLLSPHVDREWERHAIQVGAHGYVHKNARVAELVRALKAVAGGGRHFCSSLRKSRHPSSAIARVSRLSPRQRETLKLMAEGYTTKQIASRLGISGKTVDSHRAQIKGRLGVDHVAGLVRLAMRVGLVPAERVDY